MAQDVIKPKGPLKRSSPDAGGANPRMVPALGIVKDNVDPKRSGQIMVYITDNSGLDPENKDNWRPVTMLSPFYGVTRPDAGDTELGTFKTNPSSYGMWMSPPDIGTTVLCLFVDGDMNYGYYVGCVMQPEALQMVPAIGATDNIIPNEGEAKSYGGAKRLPVTNINTNNKDVADSSEYLTAAKPVHSYSATIMFQQGILRDPIRGPISSSSQRESPSRVGWGVSTPGRPIYEGGFDDTSVAENLKADKSKELRVVSRRGGHSIVMDDGDIIGRDQLVRIRTALGHQILMSDDGQTLMVLHSNGQSYIELGKEGTVDIYSTNSINLRTQGDLNLHADNNVNIHATKNLNIQGENIHINSEKEFKQRTGADHQTFTTGKHTTKVGGAYSVNSGGQASMASGAEAFVNGSKVNLNSGKTSTQPAEVPAIDKTLHTDTLFDQEKGFLAAPAKLVSITSRAPAHAPWANAGQGVDVKTDLNASSALPASPATSVQQTNTVAAASLDNPVTTASAATAPSVGGASKALTPQATQAISGAVAQAAAAGPLKDAVSKGTAIAQTAAGTEVGVGKFALTSKALEQAGTIKQGSAALVTSLASATGNIAASMPNNLFTGKDGAKDLGSLVGSVEAQAKALTTNLQQAQTALQGSGAITGNETASQLGGMVMSAAKNGVGATVDAIKSAAGSIPGLPNLPAGKLDSVMKDISAGNFAASVGEGISGALSGLQSSVEAAVKSPSLEAVADQAKGLAAGAFSAIASSFKPMEAGVPQNLTALAKKAAEATVEAGASSATNELSQAAGSLASKASGLKDAVSQGLTGSGSQLASMATGKVGSAISSAVSGAVSKAVGPALGGVISGAASGAASSILGGASKLLPSAGSVADSLMQAASGGTSTSSLIGSGKDLLSSAGKSVETAATAFAGSISSGAAALTSAAAAKGGAVAAATSTIASGLSNLPGGQAAVSSITNLAKGAVPSMPGIGDLKSAIAGASTDKLNNIAGGLTGKANDLLAKAQGTADSLTSLVTSGLPAGAAAELQSALGSIASAGSGIKVPSIALNTTDRSSITGAITSQLGDPDIPAPNFGEVSEAAKSKIEDFEKQKFDYIVKQGELLIESNKAESKMIDELDKYLKAQQNLPAGDPGIDIAKAGYDSAIAEYTAAQDKIVKLNEEFPAVALAIYGNASSNTNSASTSNTTVSSITTRVVTGNA
jgi:hypothetical protein